MLRRRLRSRSRSRRGSLECCGPCSTSRNHGRPSTIAVITQLLLTACHVRCFEEHTMTLTPLPPDRWASSPVRDPDPAVRVLDSRFERYRLDSAAVERLATG